MSQEETVNLYSVFCIQENQYVEIWSQDLPTLCPNDHPDRTIDFGKTRLIKYLSTQKFIVEEPTDGHFQHSQIILDIPSGYPGDISIHDYSYPMDLAIWKTEMMPDDENLGDTVTIAIAPDTIVGVLTQDANIGDTVLNVSTTVFTSGIVSKGVDIKLDNTFYSEEVGRVSNVDSLNFQITVETPLTQQFVAGSMVRVHICMVRDLEFHRSDKKVKVGDKGFKSKTLPAGTVIRGIYKNNDGLAKKLYATLEYYYN